MKQINNSELISLLNSNGIKMQLINGDFIKNSWGNKQIKVSFSDFAKLQEIQKEFWNISVIYN